MTTDNTGAGRVGYGNWPLLDIQINKLANSPQVDWAWEFLRRDPHYRSASFQNSQNWLAARAVDREPTIYKSTARNLAAEEWGLSTFR